jgi:hypothetical protein
MCDGRARVEEPSASDLWACVPERGYGSSCLQSLGSKQHTLAVIRLIARAETAKRMIS